MSLPVLTAVTGAAEAALVSGLELAGGEVTVVRRCVDLADLLAAAVTGEARGVVVSAALRRLDGEALSRLAADGLAVVALVEPGDDAAERRLRQLGVEEVLAAGTDARDVAAALTRAVAAVVARRAAGGDPDTGRRWADPAAALSAAEPAGEPAEPDAAIGIGTGTGTVLAVWGPTGAPGRTTVAVSVAAELAALGRSVVLVDADTYGGSVAQLLGLLDEAPGLASAVRAADLGTLDLDLLARTAPVVLPGLRVLTGISRPERWPELRPAALDRVLAMARRLAEWTVVDCGFGIELDEELTYDTAAPRRNGATVAALDQADSVLVVGAADPVGLQRLVRALGDLAELLPGRPPRVVLNRVRASAVGASSGLRRGERAGDRWAERAVRDALRRYAGVADPVVVPDDRATLDEVVLAGRTLAELAPSSPARLALAGLARTLVGDEPGAAPVADRARWLWRSGRPGVPR